MGLTIHYALHLGSTDRAEARRVVERLRQAALNLPFSRVSELTEFTGPEADYRTYPTDDSRRYLLVQAAGFLEHGDRTHDVIPSELIAFETLPGKGCEPAQFGLCRYPSTIEIDGQPVPTRCNGWKWESFCKTQYASDPTYGGIENFLRCHTALVRLLDSASQLGILADVTDESDYWTHRDTERLAQTVEDWNRMIAGIAGQFKDAAGGDIEAPIMSYPNFEHLEADARIDDPTGQPDDDDPDLDDSQS